MEEDAEGRASLSNLLYDVENKRLPEDVIKGFLKDLEARWVDGSESEAPAFPDKVFRETVKHNCETYLCQGLPEFPAQARLSRVMNAKDLLAFNIKKTKKPYAIRSSLAEEQIKRLENNGIGQAAKEFMEGRLPFAWVTRTEDLLAEIRDEERPADAARNLLGLRHFQDNEQLVEVRYPEDGLSGEKLHVPTFLEGCPSLVFRSWTDADGWGRTVNLKTLEEGLPEAVHKRTEFTSEFKVVDLGRLQPRDYAFDWATFLTKLPRPYVLGSYGDIVRYVSGR